MRIPRTSEVEQMSLEDCQKSLEELQPFKNSKSILGRQARAIIALLEQRIALLEGGDQPSEEEEPPPAEDGGKDTTVVDSTSFPQVKVIASVQGTPEVRLVRYVETSDMGHHFRD